MAATNMRKAQGMEDQSALSLFRLPIDDDLDEEARENFKLRRKEEMERIKRRMESKRRTAEREETDLQHFVASQVGCKRLRAQADQVIDDEPLNFPTPAADVTPFHQLSLPTNSAPPVNPTTVIEDDETWEDFQYIPYTQPLSDAPVVQGQFP